MFSFPFKYFLSFVSPLCVHLHLFNHLPPSVHYSIFDKRKKKKKGGRGVTLPISCSWDSSTPQEDNENSNRSSSKRLNFPETMERHLKLLSRRGRRTRDKVVHWSTRPRRGATRDTIRCNGLSVSLLFYQVTMTKWLLPPLFSFVGPVAELNKGKEKQRRARQ